MIKILLVLLLGSFVNQNESHQTPLKIIYDDSGKEFNFSVADEFFVSLKGNPTTGYTWSISKIDSALLRQIGDVEYKPESPKMGAPGQQIFRFLCLDTGSSELRLIYHRPWEKNTVPIDSFAVTVVIAK